jgi:hypothetical protein
MQISISNVIGRAISLGSYVSKLIKAFKARVAVDIGIFEAELCLSTTLKSLNTIGLLDKTSLCITPNAYKESVLYSVVPNTTLGDMTVVRATTATRVNSAGLIEGVGVNVPRIDYTNGSCPSLLVEPQRTNLLTYSEQFDNADWNKVRASVTANTTISPNGIQNADTFASSSGQTIFPALTRNPTFLGNTLYSLSIFAKVLGNTNIFKITYVDNVSGFAGGGASFNLATQAITIIQSANSSVTANIQNYGNGWYRLNIKFLTIAIPSFNYLEFSLPTANVGNDFSLYGAQLEVGSYPTSYIPTVATSVTRNADVISKTGISSLIGQTEGTIFFDGIVNDIQNIFTNILNTNKTPSTSSQIALSKVKATNKFNFDQFYGDGTFERITLLSTNSFANGIRTKVAIRYKSGDFAMYINGNLEATSSLTFTNIGTKSELFLNDSETLFAYQESVSFNNAILFKTGLSNTELAQLTTI